MIPTFLKKKRVIRIHTDTITMNAVVTVPFSDRLIGSISQSEQQLIAIMRKSIFGIDVVQQARDQLNHKWRAKLQRLHWTNKEIDVIIEKALHYGVSKPRTIHPPSPPIPPMTVK